MPVHRGVFFKIRERHLNEAQKSEQRGLKGYLGVVARGFCMGAADVVPGVSGGTMAFILGIYEELIEAIHAVNVSFARRLLSFRFREAFEDFPYWFLISVGIGIGGAIFSLAKFLNWALQQHPVLIWSFFFGLVLASVLAVRKRVPVWSPSIMVATVLAAVAAYILVGLVPVETPDAPWFLFLCGAIAICAMILPGISGSFILVLLGKYQYVLNAVVQRDFVTLLIVACGCAIGLLSFARLLGWLFHNYHNITVAALIGLMIGSLRKVWPWKETVETFVDRHGDIRPLVQANILPEAWSTEVMLAIFLAVVGCALVLLLERVADRDVQP
jgi:putative membrane protein